MEELETADWYRPRPDYAEDESLKGVLLHNMREEMEHASMLLEWIRRHSTDFDGFLRTYLFTEGSILEIEDEATAGGGKGKGKDKKPGAKPAGDDTRGFTVGSLKD